MRRRKGVTKAPGSREEQASRRGWNAGNQTRCWEVKRQRDNPPLKEGNADQAFTVCVFDFGWEDEERPQTGAMPEKPNLGGLSRRVAFVLDSSIRVVY